MISRCVPGRLRYGALLAALLLPAGWGQLRADCRNIPAARPRLYFPAPGYGTYATLRDRWKAAQQANTPEFQAMVRQATGYLTSDPNPVYYDAAGFEEAFLYNLDPVTFAASGARALNLLVKAIDQYAPSTQITAATNGSPVVFTARAHGLADGKQYTIWGGSAKWSAVNFGRATVKVLDADTFSIGVDTSSFGPLSGTLTVSANSLIGLNQARWFNPVLAAIWDWTHDAIPATLTPLQQAKILNALASAAVTVSSNWYVDPNPTGGIGNLTIGPMNGALQLALALAGDVPGMDAVCESTRKKFLEVVPQTYTDGGLLAGLPVHPLGRGGAFVESTEYSPEVVYYLMQYMLALRGATGEDFFPLLGRWYGDQMAYLAAAVSPASYAPGGRRAELFPYGDILFKNLHNNLNGTVRQDVEQLAYYFALTGDTRNLGYAEWWLQNVGNGTTVNDTVSPSLITPNEFLWYDSHLPAVDYREHLPTNYLADGFGIFLSRSSWSPDATWVGFKGGALRGWDSDHFHGDVLTFGLYRKGDWLTNELSGWGSNFGLTQFHNVPLPENGMPLQYSGSNPPLTSGVRITPTTAKIARYETASDNSYVFAEADATPVYRGSSNQYTIPRYTAAVNTMVRDLLYLKPDVVVIADRIAYDPGSPTTSRWLLQALADPGQPDGGSFTLGSLNGTQALNVAVVHPGRPIYNVVSPETQIAEAGSTAPRQWRVEISSGKTNQAEEYMVVLQAGDAGFNPLPVETLPSQNLHVAQMGDTIVGALTDTRSQNVTRSYTYSGGSAKRHIIMGLLPSTPYAVSLSIPGKVVISDAKGKRGELTTTPGGLLIFETAPAQRRGGAN